MGACSTWCSAQVVLQLCVKATGRCVPSVFTPRDQTNHVMLLHVGVCCCSSQFTAADFQRWRGGFYERLRDHMQAASASIGEHLGTGCRDWWLTASRQRPSVCLQVLVLACCVLVWRACMHVCCQACTQVASPGRRPCCSQLACAAATGALLYVKVTLASTPVAPLLLK